ncbi:hypothetical protein DAD186_00830 [Dermabacter vaginalis]|uniref:DNA/RNA non-specific endonuclease n=1 Tax=Dermabacter vaginalis TaxID=1630135 RepID=A0A1B0ZFD1_9MICO|nr:hypothetical protein [Dermabacter vaginalis]ANP26642.1 hypothetical protein DAD186_00830 [Dermabacter vaginalis]
MDLELPEIDSPGAVTGLASEIQSIGSRTFDLVSSAQETWYGLSGTYKAPEAETVYNGMRQPLKSASLLQESTNEVKAALHEYAAKLVEFHERKARLQLEIMAAELAMAAALMMPKTKTETNADGEEEEVPNDERDDAIAEAEAELSRLEDEVKKLREDMKKADEALAGTLGGGNAGNADESDGKHEGNVAERFLRGLGDSVKETLTAVVDLGKLVLKGTKSLWDNREELMEAARGLDDFVKNGGIGRMKDAAANAIKNFSPKDAAVTVAKGTKNFVVNEVDKFKEDPAYYLGHAAPDLVMTVASGGTGGAIKAGVTAGAKAAVGTAAKGGVKAAAGTAIKGAAGSGAKAATQGAVKAGALSTIKGAAKGGMHKAAGTIGTGAVARGGVKAAGSKIGGTTARAGAGSVTHHADDVARASVKQAGGKFDNFARTGAPQASSHTGAAAKVAGTNANHMAVEAGKSAAPIRSGAAASIEHRAAGKIVDSADNVAKPRGFNMKDAHPEPHRSGLGASASPADDALQDASHHLDDAPKSTASIGKTGSVEAGGPLGERTSAGRSMNEADELTPNRKASSGDTDLTKEPEPQSTTKDASQGAASAHHIDQADSPTAKVVDKADDTRATAVAERTGVDEALDNTDDFAKRGKGDGAELEVSDVSKADKPEASAPATKEAAETSTDHADDAVKGGKEGKESAVIHADDVAEKGKSTPDAEDVKTAKDYDRSDDSRGDSHREEPAGTAIREAGEHTDEASRAKSAGDGKHPEFADGRNAAGIELNEEQLRRERAEFLKPHEDGPLGETRDTIDTAHKPVDDSHFSQHHHADAADVNHKPNVSADEFYEKTGRETLIEDARAKGDLDRVAELEKLDANDIRAEYHQLKFDEYVERQRMSGEEFDFENNLKKRPEDEWRGANIEYSVNEGSYVKDNNSLLPESLPDKVERKKGEAPKPQISVVDYVNENMREVTVQVGRNKIAYRQYPNYIESEAVIFDKFTTVKRVDGTQANKALLEAGSFQMDPDDPTKKLMQTNRPDMPVDEKGHLIAHMFAPNLGSGNYLAQHNVVNHETIYNMEMIQSDAIMKQDSFTHFSTRATLDSNGRPTAYHAIADIYDRETGKQWLRIDGAVHNDKHDYFHREPKKTQVNTYGRDFSAKALSEVKANALDSGSVPRVHFDQVNQH